jgi:ketosteroid isomerase-like protein
LVFLKTDKTVKGKNKNQEEFSNSAVMISRISNGKITRMQRYIFDTDVAKRVWQG